MKQKLRLIKENKKKGFTLIELIAVLAIIALLMVVFVPKVSGYIGEAKKVKALEQARQVVLAVDSYNITATQPITESETFSGITTKISNYCSSKGLVDMTQINNISSTMTYSEMKELLQEGKDYYLDEDGYLKKVTTQ